MDILTAWAFLRMDERCYLPPFELICVFFFCLFEYYTVFEWLVRLRKISLGGENISERVNGPTLLSTRSAGVRKPYVLNVTSIRSTKLYENSILITNSLTDRVWLRLLMKERSHEGLTKEYGIFIWENDSGRWCYTATLRSVSGLELDSSGQKSMALEEVPML